MARSCAWSRPRPRTFRRARRCGFICRRIGAGYWRMANSLHAEEATLKKPTFSRRQWLQGSGALAASNLFASVASSAPPASAVTPQLIEAAKKEGKIVFYTSIDLPVAERIAKAFEAKYPGITARVERSGAERIFQRIGQEYGSRIYAVDVVNSSDASHFIVWKRDGWLAPYVPEDVAKHYQPQHKDPDGCFATWRAFFSVIGYNTHLLKPLH